MGKKTISDDKKVVVKSLVDAGMPYRKVNEVTGVSLGLIGRIVRQFEADKGLVEWYQRNRIDVLRAAQVENLALQQAIRDTLTEEEIRKLTPDQKARWFGALGIDHAVKVDKERLLAGESTDNVAVIVKHIRELKEQEEE